MDDKRMRQMAMALLGILIVLGALSLVSTLTQLLVPLAVLAVGGFAFYKIVLEGRDEPDVMADEIAESAAPPARDADDAEQAAGERLSAVEQARRTYVDSTAPAQEILDHIKARQERLQGDEEA